MAGTNRLSDDLLGISPNLGDYINLLTSLNTRSPFIQIESQFTKLTNFFDFEYSSVTTAIPGDQPNPALLEDSIL